MNDMRAVIIPKSDQINADDLLGGPRTITITRVEIRPGQDQPCSVFFEGDGGKPYKPGKSMSRVMVHCWGPNANEYIGRSMTLFCDPKVRFGWFETGGIRISHISHIKAAMTMALTATKGSRKPFTVQPLVIEEKKASRRTVREIAHDALESATTAEEVHAVSDITAVKRALVEAPENIREEIGAMIAAALERVSGGEIPEDVV